MKRNHLKKPLASVPLAAPAPLATRDVGGMVAMGALAGGLGMVVFSAAKLYGLGTLGAALAGPVVAGGAFLLLTRRLRSA